MAAVRGGQGVFQPIQFHSDHISVFVSTKFQLNHGGLLASALKSEICIFHFNFTKMNELPKKSVKYWSIISFQTKVMLQLCQH